MHNHSSHHMVFKHCTYTRDIPLFGCWEDLQSVACRLDSRPGQQPKANYKSRHRQKAL